MNTFLIFCVIFVVFLTVYYQKYKFSSSYVKSNVDQKYYLVRDLPDKQEVADTLAYIRNNVKLLIDEMKKTAPTKYRPYIKTLDEKFNDVPISENINEYFYTSYSVNKGEELVFCMRSRKDKENDQTHDTNLMMYVVLHEISHIACPEYGHGDLFKEIFKFITQSAVKMGIYSPIDFKNIPTEYCGMTITDSIV